MITLGVIGIVAAMTIPGLINNYSKHVIEANLKETYSILQQTMKFTEYDDVSMDINIPDNISGMKLWFTTFLQPHLKYAQVCYDEAGCWQSKTATKTLLGGTAGWNRTGIGVGQGIITIRLTNGASLCLDGFTKSDMKNWFGTSVTDSTGLVVYIDANGDRPPNVIGKDIFIVAFTPDKGLVPAGVDETKETVAKNCSASATGTNSGYYCLSRVKDNGWEIPGDVWNFKTP